MACMARVLLLARLASFLLSGRSTEGLGSSDARNPGTPLSIGPCPVLRGFSRLGSPSSQSRASSPCRPISLRHQAPVPRPDARCWSSTDPPRPKTRPPSAARVVRSIRGLLLDCRSLPCSHLLARQAVVVGLAKAGFASGLQSSNNNVIMMY